MYKKTIAISIIYDIIKKGYIKYLLFFLIFCLTRQKNCAIII